MRRATLLAIGVAAAALMLVTRARGPRRPTGRSSSSSASTAWIRTLVDVDRQGGELPALTTDEERRAHRLETTRLAGVADRVGVVRDRRQPRQAQHLRLPRPRHERRTCPTSAWSHASRRRFSSTTFRSSRPKVTSIRGGTSFWVTAGKAGVRIEHAHGAGHVPARRRAERRDAVGPAAARHPRHDGHVLLLRDRPEPLRRRQHRVRRHPQAAGRSTATSRRPSWSGRRTRSSSSRSGDRAQKGRAERRRPARRSPSSKAREDVRLPLDDHWNARQRDGDGRDRRPVDSRSSTGEWSKWINLDFNINFLVRVHGMVQLLSDRTPATSCSCTSRRSTGGRTSRRCRCRRRRRSPRDLYERLGPYRTLGWAEATWPLNEGPHRREDVHGRSVPRVRRPRAGHPPAARRAASGTCWSASSSRPIACST